jgi:hypothetical protein
MHLYPSNPTLLSMHIAPVPHRGSVPVPSFSQVFSKHSAASFIVGLP